MQNGLSTTEAKILLHQVGPNKFGETHAFSFFGLLFREAFNFLNVLLAIAALVSISIGDYIDSVMIFAIVILNIIISFWQEYKAERTLEELKELAHSHSRVIRDGKEVLLDSTHLVPGDVLLLSSGDKVPADARVLEAFNLEVNESSLTGEAISVPKKTEQDEGHNLVFAGTIVTAGRGRVQVYSTGIKTRFGKIAQTLAVIPETETPLQNQIKHLTLNISFVAVFLSTVIYVTGIALKHDKATMFLTAVSSAVAAIPEGLPAIILITLAVGVKRLAVRKAVVRKVISVEALGAINVICTDKTGTLTQGQMAVTKLWFQHKLYSPAEFKHLLGQSSAKKFLDAILLPNTASLTHEVGANNKIVLGDTTDGALLLLGRSLGIDYEIHKNQGKILDEFSFDQRRKTMSVVWEKDGQALSFVKSSPEFMLTSATRTMHGNDIRLLTEEDKQKLLLAYQSLAKTGSRVLAFGFKEVPKGTNFLRNDLESDLIFLGFAALSDPIRPEAKESIRIATAAGIKTVMVTGDNELTALAVARELDLAVAGDEVMLGKDLERTSDDELKSLILKIKIFARTNPEDKLRIVRAFQRAGLAVAVTGDGVNDSLALKQAEIGVAMGRKGTDVAKEAADIVITDDNYSTIIKAVEEGRTIYDNVLKSIRYLVSTNIAELLTILLALFMGLPSPFLPSQILWINLVSDGLPAIALALDPKDPHSMKKMPRGKQEKLLDFYSWGYLVLLGLAVAVVTLIIYRVILKTTNNLVLARTWTFTALILLQLLIAFVIRGNRRNFNSKLAWASIITIVIQFVILLSPPLYSVFHIQKPW